MNITFLNEKIIFHIEAYNKLYCIEFERNSKNAPRNMKLIDVRENKTVYRSRLEASITPDIQFAEEVLHTYLTRGNA